MASEDLEGADLMALRSRLKKQPPREGALADRRAAERRATMSKTDGRRSRGGRQRDTQINIKTSADVKALLLQLKDRLGLSMIETFERAIEDLDRATQNGKSN